MVMPSLWGCLTKPHLVICLFQSLRSRGPTDMSLFAAMSHHQGRACLQEDREMKVRKSRVHGCWTRFPHHSGLTLGPCPDPEHRGKEQQKQAQLESIIY